MNDPAADKTALSYKGPIAGLKGLLSNKLTEGLASVVSTIDRALENESNIGTQAIAIEEIHPCPDQPRQVFEPQALEELAQTMSQVGQAQAITVRKSGTGYEIISGERRYRAAKLAGLKTLDCLVKDCTSREARLLALVENIQRQDLLPIEEAHYLKRVLAENSELSLDKLAKLLGSHKSTLSEKVQLAEVPEELQPMLYGKGRHFTHRHWRVVSRISDAAFLRSMVMKAIENQLSVAELERSLAAAGVSKALRRRALIDAGGPVRAAVNLVRREGDKIRIRALSLDIKNVETKARLQLMGELEELLRVLREEIQTLIQGNWMGKYPLDLWESHTHWRN